MPSTRFVYDSSNSSLFTRVGLLILICIYRLVEPLLDAYTIFPKLAAGSILFLLTACFTVGAFHDGHHSAVLPLVSHVGNFYPAGGLFAFLINLVGCLFLIVAAIRYVQIRAIITDPAFEKLVPNPFHLAQQIRVPPRWTKRWLYFGNKVALFTGLLIALSFMNTGVVRFLETTEWHRQVAAPIFVLTPFYVYMQFYFTSVFLGPVNTLRTYCYRLIVWALNLVVFLGYMHSIGMCNSHYPNTTFHPVARLNWSIDQPGYWWHLSACLFEWAFLASLVPFLLSLVPEFSRLNFVDMRHVYLFGKVRGADDDDGTDQSNARLLIALLATGETFYSKEL